MVLRDDDAAGRKERSRSKNSQHALVLFGRRVRRVEKNKIKCGTVRFPLCGQHLQTAEGVGAEHGRTGAHAERFQVLANQRHGGRMIFDEDDFRGAAAERFNAHRACPRKNINESRARDCGTQHIEKRFPQTVARGAQSKAFEAFQDTAAIGSSNDAHEIAILQTQDGELNSPLQKRARPARQTRQQIEPFTRLRLCHSAGRARSISCSEDARAGSSASENASRRACSSSSRSRRGLATWKPRSPD